MTDRAGATSGGNLSDYLVAAARCCPDAEAVRFRGRSIRYRELDQLSAALAATLAGRGVRPGDRVGIWAAKSIEAVVAIHAVLKLHAAYVPVDPLAPAKRAAYILRDCGVRALVTTEEHLALVGDAIPRLAAVVLVDGDGTPRAPRSVARLGWSEATATTPPPDAGRPDGPAPDDLAYVLYTSGSTGVPKGVMLSHGNGRVFVDWASRLLGVGGDDTLASHAPFHFDLSIFDVFAAAGAGASLVLVPENQRSLGHALNRFVIDEGISIWYSVPSALMKMLGTANASVLAASPLRAVLFAGEVFPTKHLRRLREAIPDVDLYNLYGPTETNVCTYHQVTDDDIESGAVPIGRPCDYASAFVVDDSGQLVEGTGVGELCIGGSSVMVGYWGDPEKTAERLGSGPGEVDEHLVYRTGDMVRRDGQGRLVYVGRRDHMVKVRGHRIELGEVESVLLGHADVDQAAVVVVADAEGSPQLAACVVMPSAMPPSEAELRRLCLDALPRYMLPARIHVYESLPLTSTGKVDRPALAASLEQRAGSSR